ncbi:S-layer homology domain-containing protein [Paenibacillus oryzisoli]|uniref:S-layer homology domain-containing protein n=1 Tax=Paenibacillus oryzisoli TaxID=1850517 RepID=UPI003D2E37D7
MHSSKSRRIMAIVFASALAFSVFSSVSFAATPATPAVADSKHITDLDFSNQSATPARLVSKTGIDSISAIGILTITDSNNHTAAISTAGNNSIFVLVDWINANMGTTAARAYVENPDNPDKFVIESTATGSSATLTLGDSMASYLFTTTSATGTSGIKNKTFTIADMDNDTATINLTTDYTSSGIGGIVADVNAALNNAHVDVGAFVLNPTTIELISTGNGQAAVINLGGANYTDFFAEASYQGQDAVKANVNLNKSLVANAVFGQVINSSVTITSDDPQVTAAATGTVTLTIDNDSSQTASLSNGVASFVTSILPAGDHTFVYTYGGDANYNGATTTGTLIVNPAVVSSLTANPSSVSIIAGQSASLPVVTAVYSDQSTAVIAPSDMTWTFGVPGIASIVNDELNGVNVGNTVLTATYGGQSVNIQVAVTAPITVTAVDVSPTDMVVDFGQTQQITVTAHLSNSTIQDVTSLATFDPEKSGIVNVNNTGLVTALNSGETTINVTYLGNTIPITVTVPQHSSGTSEPASTPTSTQTPTPTPTPIPTTTSIFNSDVVKTDKNVVDSIKEKVAEVKVSHSSSNPVVEPSDTKGHWAEKTINTFEKLGVIKGYEDGSAKPDAPITRAEFVTIITRTFGITGGSKSDASFSDVSDHWAYQSIMTLAQAGVISGYEDLSFRPDKTITREEMVVILSRIINMNGVSKDTSKGNFSDLNDSYASDAIKNAAETGIIDGIGDSKFVPKARSTRAEALTVILKTLNLNPDVKTLLDSIN